MADLPLRPAPSAPTAPAKDGKPAMASVSNCVVADGCIKADDVSYRRLTLVLRPIKPSGNGDVPLNQWPSAIMDRYFQGSALRKEIRIASVKGLANLKSLEDIGDLKKKIEAIKVETVAAKLVWRDNGADLKEIDKFWQRMMEPVPPAAGTKSVWQNMVQALDWREEGRTRLVLPTPQGPASLLYTLGRGRMLLEALAGPDSPLFTDDTLLPDINMAARPWYQGDKPIQIASAANIDIPAPGYSPEHDAYWTAPYRKMTEQMLAGQKPDPIWPPAETFAQAILKGGRLAADLTDRVRAAHYLTTPVNEALPVCSSEQEARQTAQRRLGALLGLPSLQRLFGFAFDLMIDEMKFADAVHAVYPDKPDKCFLLVSIKDDDSSWSLVRYETSGVFCPASWDEVEACPAERILGLRNLAAVSNDIPRYDIITVDAALATESDINASAGKASPAHRAPQAAQGSALSPAEKGVPVLHNGGLRVIYLPEELPDAAQEKDEKKPKPLIHDADDLAVGDRLMIGVSVGTANDPKFIWRSPDYRSIKFEDPAKKDWVENEIARRLHPQKEQRRLELDGAMAMPAVQTSADTVSNQEPPSDKKEPYREQAIKLIADSTIALWGSDPGGVPPPGYDEEKRRTITETNTPVVEELDVSRTFSAPSRRYNHPAETLSPSLRFGWPYYTAVATVFAGGACANAADVGKVVAANPTLALPSTTLRGRRFLRHERINAPMSLIIENDYNRLNTLNPPQRGADMYVRTMNVAQAKHDVPRSRRLLVPPPVPLQFAMLHDVLRNQGNRVTVPRSGLRGLSLLGSNDDKKPHRVAIGQAKDGRRDLYYPDPAASVLVLGLKLPREKGLDAEPFVEPPIAIPIGAQTWPDVDAAKAAHPWPDITPLHIETVAFKRTDKDKNDKPRVTPLGLHWLTAEGRLTPRKEPGAVQVQAVEIRLCEGEAFALQAWCVPTVNQIGHWFDSAEAAGVLAMTGTPTKGDAHAACLARLRFLLGSKFRYDPASDPQYADTAIGDAAARACVGAGGLTAPPLQSVMMLAGLTHRELLTRAVPVLATPLTMRVTHAIADARLPQPILGTDLTVTRRLFSGGTGQPVTAEDPPAKATPAAANGARAPAVAPVAKKENEKVHTKNPAPNSETMFDFLNRTSASDWGVNSTEEGAISALFGGTIQFDPTSTSGLAVEVSCAAPGGEALDPEAGRTKSQQVFGQFPTEADAGQLFGFEIDKDGLPQFRLRTVTVLNLEGLPLPVDGRARLREYRIEDLMAAAWGNAGRYGEALRAALPAALTTTGARRLWLNVVPVNRHAGLLPPPPDQTDKAPKESEARYSEPKDKPPHLWLPATTRPSPPVIDHVSVAPRQTPITAIDGMNGTVTFGVEQTSSITIWQSRPFPSVSEDEMLAIVLWPPALFARGNRIDKKEAGADPNDFDFYDEDLGPGGSYITRWASDPLIIGDMSAEAFKNGPFIDPAHLSDDGIKIAHAFMPIPVSNEKMVPSDDANKDAKAATPEQAVPDADSGQFLSVALQAFRPRFDVQSELFYVNFDLKTDPLAFPRVRLGIVRYQPHSREDDMPIEGAEPVRLRVSTPVRYLVKPLPPRRATVTCRERFDQKTKVRTTEVIVVVDGPLADPSKNMKTKNTPAGAGIELVVELLRYKTHGGVKQEDVAKDIKGEDTLCKDWSADPADVSSRGLRQPSPRGFSWTCIFVVPGPLQDGEWSHAVTVTEARTLPRASSPEGDKIGRLGSNFFARIELKKSPAI